MNQNNYVYGVHDDHPGHILGNRGWVVITEAIGRDPNDRSGKSYDHLRNRGLAVIVRLNNGYGNPTGTIPQVQFYRDFAQRCANFVRASSGCDKWIIGNEPNLHNERPGEPIYPNQYAECYKLCRATIRSVQPDAEVLLAGSGPWNSQTPYQGNNRGGHGDWIQYTADCIRGVNPNNFVNEVDGIALHAYTHGLDPALVKSEAKMGPPFQDRRYHFRTYRDYCTMLRQIGYLNKPLYITEMNGDDSQWRVQDNGFIQALYREIDEWNRGTPDQVIKCGVIFRWIEPHNWGISDKAGVQNDLRKAVAQGFTWNDKVGKPPTQPPDPDRPPTSPGPECDQAKIQAALEETLKTTAALLEAQASIVAAIRTNNEATKLLESM